MTSLSIHTIRKTNKVVVLNYIRKHPNTSRSKVAEETGLNKATVSSLVDELIEEHFVRESGFDSSKGGRKPIKLNYQGDSGYCIGIDVQVNHLTCALFDLHGRTVYSYCYLESISSYPDKSALYDIISAQIRRLIEVTQHTAHGIIGIGIALPSVVDSKRSYFKFPKLDIQEPTLQDVISNEYHIPVYVESDTNCGAFAVLKKHDISNAVFVYIGVGIGVGIVINGRLYRGSSGAAGDFGHTTISALGMQCLCGGYGCWEEYASERALARYLIENEYQGLNYFIESGNTFVSRCISSAEYDVKVQHALAKVGQYIGVGLANVVNSLNPERVIVGGNLVRAHKHMINDMDHYLHLYATPVNKEIPLLIADPQEVISGLSELVIETRLSELI